jgi:hypothetical protein
MTQQIKIKTKDGHEKRLYDWNPEKREITTILGQEQLTHRLMENQTFSLVDRRPKPKKT